MKTPIKESFWTDCLFELMEKANREGKKTVEFSDVDALVLEKSKVMQRRHLIAHAADGEKVGDNTACGREGGAAPYILKYHCTTAD